MEKKQGVFKRFPTTFWVANTMELFERWAWYGLFAVLALYLTNSTDEGALGFTQSQKGNIMGPVTGILYLLPIITGALADRVGYKKILLIAYGILSSGYFLMSYFTSYTTVFMAFLYIAVGAALFKPVISATITKTTDDKTSSIGFGIFYMMVNVGGFIGPVFSSKLRGVFGWDAVFIMSAVAIAINIVLVSLFYKEPDREPSTESISESVKSSLKNIVEALKDVKLSIFLVIMIGFWTVFNQLFYTLPNFIDQWVDTSLIYNALADISPALAAAVGTKDGTIAPEMMINLDAGFIILFQVLVSSFVMRFKPVNVITSGLVVVAIGIGITFATSNPFFTVLGIFIFALGEMGSSPKFTEYVGKIAPKGKEALYMGTSFLPIAAGNVFAGILSGQVYENMSDRVNIVKQEVSKQGFEIGEIGEGFSQNDYIAEATRQMGMTHHEFMNYLWESYNPSKIWYLFSAIGVLTVLALLIYDKFILKTNSGK